MAGFAGFGGGAIDWLTTLAANNSRDWFQANRARFEAELRDPMAALLEEAAALHGGEAKVFRQNRDTRFSRDKTPYKTAIYGGVYGPGVMGLYACLDAKGFFAGVGAYAFAPDQLARFRAAAAAEETGPALVAAIADAAGAGLVLEEGDALRSAPRGYDKDHPRADLLRRKNLILGARIGPKEALAGRASADHAFLVWRAARPVADWVDAHVGASTAPPRGRPR
jgi:uncharacterized protein (TIGR02453 family)